MCDSFYAERLEVQGISTFDPDHENCTKVDQIIFDELAQGKFTDASRGRYAEIMDDLKTRGADAVALSCTELGLLAPTRDIILCRASTRLTRMLLRLWNG